MESVKTNQNYRKILVKNAFETMKSNRHEYSKQSIFYLPKKSIEAREKKHNINK